MLNFKWRHFKQDIILMLVRWYLAYSLSYRDVEELALERGLKVDHSTINRWVIEYAPKLEEIFRKRHKHPVGSSWRMDETYIKAKGQWVYLYRANVRQIKYLNNIVEQNHRFIKKITKPMKEFKAFHSANSTLAGMELHHMLRKGQHSQAGNQSIFEQFYGLAA
ncbi:MAG: IS6 family transposase ISBmu21 [Legionella sp.]|uniref:IS6 family transposase n=1 Tax=Legionella sp. TaxID=459 RepID=UPI003D0B0A2E